jgi:hypothetical protein
MATLEVTPLYDACLRREDERRVERINQIAVMKDRLAMLDAYMPAIQDAGLSLSLETIFPSGTDMLMVSCKSSCSSRDDNRLIEVLLAQGFELIDRFDLTSFYWVTLRKDGLKISIQVFIPKALIATESGRHA